MNKLRMQEVLRNKKTKQNMDITKNSFVLQNIYTSRLKKGNSLSSRDISMSQQ